MPTEANRSPRKPCQKAKLWLRGQVAVPQCRIQARLACDPLRVPGFLNLRVRIKTCEEPLKELRAIDRSFQEMARRNGVLPGIGELSDLATAWLHGKPRPKLTIPKLSGVSPLISIDHVALYATLYVAGYKRGYLVGYVKHFLYLPIHRRDQ